MFTSHRQDMETIGNDKLLKKFFEERKQEIVDNGFSKRVMQKLPEQTNHSWIMWAFTCIGMIISLYLGVSSGLIQNLMTIAQQIPIYYFVAGIFCFPIIGSIGMFFVKSNNFGELD